MGALAMAKVYPPPEMVVGQDRPTHNGKIRIGAYKVMRKLSDEIQHFAEAGVVDLHRRMFGIKDDAVLLIVYIRRILQKPGLSVNRYGDYPVILSGRVVDSACVPFIFPAELASGIEGSRHVSGRRNGLGILFRLGKINRDIHLSIGSFRFPAHVPGDAVSADIVGILAELVIPVGSFFRAFFIKGPESGNDFPGGGVRRPMREVSRRSR